VAGYSEKEMDNDVSIKMVPCEACHSKAAASFSLLTFTTFVTSTEGHYVYWSFGVEKSKKERKEKGERIL
jgi:hypothetical protein